MFERWLSAARPRLRGRAKRTSGALAKDPSHSRFKLDIVQGIPGGEEISYFKNGYFVDLSAGSPRDAHREHRRVQAHARRERSYYKETKATAAPANLRDGVQEQDRTRGLL